MSRPRSTGFEPATGSVRSSSPRLGTPPGCRRDAGATPSARLPAMPRDRNVPDWFDVLTVVILRRPPNAPQMTDEELDALQGRHLAYRAELRDRGILVVNGPLVEQTDVSLRGLSIFACSLEE